MNALLSTRSLRKSYGDLDAVRGVDLDGQAGEGSTDARLIAVQGQAVGRGGGQAGNGAGHDDLRTVVATHGVDRNDGPAIVHGADLPAGAGPDSGRGPAGWTLRWPGSRPDRVAPGPGPYCRFPTPGSYFSTTRTSRSP